MRASRLLSIQMLLETRGRMSARALADTLEVSIRTLYRDMDELTAAGVPVFSERGRSGGFELMRGWTTTLTGLTPLEAQAVFLCGLSGPAADLGLDQHVKQAQLKLLTAIPATSRDSARRVSARLYLDPIDWYRQSDPIPHLAVVASGVWSDRKLTLRYQSWKQISRLVVSPLGLVLKAGAWYLVASCKGKPRTYRVSNVLEVEVREDRADRPRNFDLAAHWRASVRRFESEVFRGEATVMANPAGLKSLCHLGAAIAKRVAKVRIPSNASQRTQLRIPIESIEHATGQLLQFAPDVEIVDPPELRRSTLERVRRIADIYL